MKQNNNVPFMCLSIVIALVSLFSCFEFYDNLILTDVKGCFIDCFWFSFIEILNHILLVCDLGYAKDDNILRIFNKICIILLIPAILILIIPIGIEFEKLLVNTENMIVFNFDGNLVEYQEKAVIMSFAHYCILTPVVVGITSVVNLAEKIISLSRKK